MQNKNIFQNIPNNLKEELFEDIISTYKLKIERIVSQGNTTPAGEWYDQDSNEWVIVIQGGATISFENEKDVNLTTGDYINIPAHQKHRVAWTDKNTQTIWLAVYY